MASDASLYVMGEVSAEPSSAVSSSTGPYGELTTLYQAHHARLVRLAFLITRSASTADEIVQESFLKLHQRWDEVSDPSAYVNQVVVNEAKGVLRRREIEQRHVRSVREQVPPPEVDEMWTMLDGLSPRRRVALVLRYYEDLSIEEIAVLMDCRPSTVKSLIHRGLESLRRKLNVNTK